MLMNLSDTEYEIMTLIWSSAEELSFGQIQDFFNNTQDKQWKKQTLSTYITRLTKLGAISSTKDGRTNYYKALISKKEYDCTKARSILDKLYDGSISSLVATLYDGGKLDESEIKELKSLIGDMEE